MLEPSDVELSNETIKSFVERRRWQFYWDHHGMWVLDLLGGRVMVAENRFTIEHNGETLSYEVPGVHNIFKDHQLKRMVREIRKAVPDNFQDQQ